MERLEAIHPSSDAFVWQEKKSSARTILPAECVPGRQKHTHKESCGIIHHLGLELSLKPERTAVEGQENNRKTHTHAHFPTLLCFKGLSIANIRLRYYE